MANSGFQHLRFLQIVGRGRWWAHINCQRFLCLVWKLYSMYPGRASALSAPGDPWPVQCHWVLTAGSQSPPAAPPAFCCPLDVTCLTLGVLTWFFYSSAWLQEDCHWNCTPVWKLPIRVGLLPGHTGLSLDHRSQQNNLTLDLKNTPETFARKARSPSLLLLTISIWLLPSKRQCPLTSAWLIAKV